MEATKEPVNLIPRTISAQTTNLKVLVRSRKRVTRVLLNVVLVFLICWAPFVIYCGFIERKLRGFPYPMDGVRLWNVWTRPSQFHVQPFHLLLQHWWKKNRCGARFVSGISTGRKRNSSTNSQRAERKISNTSQLSSLKQVVELKRVMEYQPEDIDQGNKNRVTNYELWEYVEEMWLPFIVWPPAQDLRESVL